MPRRLRCSFCGKGEADVAKLVAGPKVYICDQCVARADRIMRELPGDERDGPEARRGLLRSALNRIGLAVRRRASGRTAQCHAVAPWHGSAA